MIEGRNTACEVRAARPGDALPIAAVNVASWQKAYQGLLADAYLADLAVDDRIRHWEGLMGSLADDHLLVAEVGSSVVGYAHVGPSRDAEATPGTGELYSLYLHPDTWGTGIGRAIHDAALARLKEDGFALATVWVLGTNLRARRFYTRQGWWPVAGVRTQEFGGREVTDDRYGRTLPVD